MTQSTHDPSSETRSDVPWEILLPEIHRDITEKLVLPARSVPTLPPGKQFDLLDAYLFWSDSFTNVFPLSMLMMKVMTSVPSLGFQDFERRLRGLRSRSFLVANPNRVAGYKFIDPRTGQATPYYLWISLFGLEEFNRQIRNFGWQSYEDNFARLASTGVMVQP